MNAYFDASALVKLVFKEPGWQDALTHWREADSVASARVVYAEGRAALAAARRARRISRGQSARLRRLLDELIDEIDLIEAGAGVVELAGDVSDRYALRALDAVHLACALVLQDQDLVFVSWDVDLRSAATDAGFALAPAA